MTMFGEYKHRKIQLSFIQNNSNILFLDKTHCSFRIN